MDPHNTPLNIQQGIKPSIAGHGCLLRSDELREACDAFFRRRGLATGPGSSPWANHPKKKTKPKRR